MKGTFSIKKKLLCRVDVSMGNQMVVIEIPE